MNNTIQIDTDKQIYVVTSCHKDCTIFDSTIKEYFKGKKNSSIPIMLKTLSDELKEYLGIRFNDSENIKESVFRILYNIKEKPKCPICGKNCKYKGGTTYYKTCGNKICSKKLNVKTGEKTNLQKYNVRRPIQNKDIQQKLQQTNIEKYGVNEWAKSEEGKHKLSKIFKTDNILKKKKETCLNRYGVPYITQVKQFKDSIKLTLYNKYGTFNSFNPQQICNDISNQLKIDNIDINDKLYDIKLKDLILQNISIKNVCLNINDNIDFWNTSIIGNKTLKEILEEITPQDKINQTKRKNGTFNTSQPEERCYQKLIQIYPNTIRQYRSNLYPFNCDFYIPEKDLYIEYQGSWTHGNHPFNESNKDDTAKLSYWKSQNSDYYNNAIDTWTKRDVKKRTIAKQNNINFIEFFNEDEFNEWYKTL